MPIRKKAEPIPEEFASYEEAASFWNKHDSADYKDILEAVEVEVDLSERHYIIELDKEAAQVLQNKAQERGIKPNQLASELLQKTLTGGK